MKPKHGIFILLIILLFSVLSYAQDIKLKSIGLGGGIFLPQSEWDAGYYIELNGGFGEVLDYIFSYPYIDFMRSVRSEDISEKPTRLSLQYLSFGSKFIGYLDSQPKGLYLGTDISFNLISSEGIQTSSDYINNDIKTLNHTKIGLSLLMGYLFKLEKVDFNIESRYTFIQGGFSIFQLGLGCNYIL